MLRVTAYIVGVENWAAFDRALALALGSWKPAQTIVPVPELHHGYLVEVEAIAAAAL
ncbi:RidA family protein [Sphingomonas sp. BK235]|uniref:RidA family protein n=1 Tax=Sphingomonas sp. BK235 TaxID=2512131 RepID=UPI00326189E8